MADSGKEMRDKDSGVLGSGSFNLVLSGGGARGIAQIGVLKALNENDIVPDTIVGVSMGAVIGLLYSCCYAPDSILSVMNSIEWESVFADDPGRKDLPIFKRDRYTKDFIEMEFNDSMAPQIPNSISSGQIFYDLLAPLTSPFLFRADGNFLKLPVPLKVVSTDLVSGNPRVFTQGDLVEAVKASSSFPIALEPVKRDSMLLVDGGIMMNIPVKPAKVNENDCVLAVDVTSPLDSIEKLESPINLMQQVIGVNIKHKEDREKELADMVLTPDLNGISNQDFKSAARLVELGYREAVKRMDEIRDLYDACGPERPQEEKVLIIEHLGDRVLESRCSTDLKREMMCVISAYLDSSGIPYSGVAIKESGDTVVAEVSPARVSGIEVLGNERVVDEYILRRLSIEKGDTLTSERIKENITSLYSTCMFNNVNIFFSKDNIVIVKVAEKNYLKVRAGLRIDEYNLLEGFLEPVYENLFGRGIALSLHLQNGGLREKYSLDMNLSGMLLRNLQTRVFGTGYVSRESIIHYNEYSDTLADSSLVSRISYDEKSLRKSGIAGGMGFQIYKSLFAGFLARMEKYKMSYSDSWVFKSFPGPGLENGIRSVNADITFDNLDSYPVSTTGVYSSLNISRAFDILEGSVQFLKINNRTKAFFTPVSGHTFSLGSDMCWSDRALPSTERMHLGGNSTDLNRDIIDVYTHIPFSGLPSHSLSGDVVLKGNIEYRINIYKELYFSLRASMGDIWTYEDFSFSESTARDFFSNSLVGIGTEISLKTFFGPVRIAWGRLLRTEKQSLNNSEEPGSVIYFSAGHDF